MFFSILQLIMLKRISQSLFMKVVCNLHHYPLLLVKNSCEQCCEYANINNRIILQFSTSLLSSFSLPTPSFLIISYLYKFANIELVWFWTIKLSAGDLGQKLFRCWIMCFCFLDRVGSLQSFFSLKSHDLFMFFCISE